MRPTERDGLLHAVIARLPGHSDFEIMAVRYMIEKWDVAKQAMTDAVDAVKPDRGGAVVNAAVMEVMEEGMVQGKAEMLADLMQQRFGPLPEAMRSRIASASGDQLDAWGKAFVHAQSPEAVFQPQP